MESGRIPPWPLTPRLSVPVRPLPPSNTCFDFSSKLLLVFFENAHSWSQFVQHVRGVSHIYAKVGSLPHPVAALLKQLQTVGVQIVTSDKPWDGPTLDDKAAEVLTNLRRTTVSLCGGDGRLL